MLIQQITLSNIYTFLDAQRIDLPTDGESNLVVILARNSSGKTSLLRALKLLFYGFANEREATLAVNLEATRRATKGDIVESHVKAKFTVGKRKYTLHRRIRVQVGSGGASATRFFDSDWVLISHESAKDVKYTDADIVRGRIREMLPDP